MLPSPPPDIPGPAPLELDGYDFVQALGTTPLARVGCYLDRASGAHVVVKEVHPEVCSLPGFEERFHDRIAASGAVGHPGLLRLLGYGRTDIGGLYLIREYVDGFPLRAWMDTTAMDHVGALHIVTTLAPAIETWHRHGRAHGAVNAASVWIGTDSAIRLEVFPVSALLEPAQLVQLLGLEVVNTMPPEFTSGSPATPQSDLYALAALYYELLTGTVPRGAINRISASAKVDFRVSQVILKALAQDPSQRQASISEFCQPLLGLAAASPPPQMAAPRGSAAYSRPQTGVIKPLLATLCLAGVAAGLGGYLWTRSHGRKTAAPEPVATSGTQTPPAKEPIAANPPPAEPKVPGVAVAPQLRLAGIDGGSDHVELEFVLLNPAQVRPLLRLADTRPAGPNNGGLPATRYVFEDGHGTPLGDAREVPEDLESPVFRLALDLSEPTPSEVRLVLTHLRDRPRLASDLVAVADRIGTHRQAHPPDRSRAVVGRLLPSAPPPTPSAGDAYIYAAHFYLGSEVGLLKLQFGNAGTGPLSCQNLSFQCAFSTDDRLDALAPADSGTPPTPGMDVAAGGFTSTWLGLDRSYLMAGKKLWTKHTFRIDTANPDLLARAKFLLVKISPLHAVPESDYQNNVIAIPLDHANAWHTVTQDPADAEPAADAPPKPADPPATPVGP